MNIEKPKAVRKAQLEDNHDALSRMGKKGASRRVQLEDLRTAEKRRVAANQAEFYKLSPDGDVLPPDPPDRAEHAEEE